MKVSVALIGLMIVFSSCSGKSERELYAEAQVAIDQKDFHGAIALLRQVVEKNQASAYAESSQYRIALIYNNDLHDAPQALLAYHHFRRLFPESREAPTALFLSAFLQNNELHQLDSAKALYGEFLQRYPNHELAHSAQFELESLGKDPMQYLKSQVAADEKPAEPPPKKKKGK